MPSSPLTAASLGVLMAAGPASAAVTINVVGTTLTVVSDTASDEVALSCVGGNVSPTPASGPAACAAITSVDVSLNVGDDRADLRGVTMDDFRGLTGMDVRGDAGQDTLLGVRGAANGGDGNDRFIAPAVGPVVGGGGSDSVEFDYGDQPGLRVDFTITDAAFMITDAASTNTATVSASGIEQYVLSMPDGPVDADNVNRVDSVGYAGRLVVRLQSGADTFTGGPGDDFVGAGPGTDSVNPGAGRDAVQGGEGEDSIYTLDGEVDTVDCGDGTDTITADRGDVLKNWRDREPAAAPAARARAGPRDQRGRRAQAAQARHEGLVRLRRLDDLGVVRVPRGQQVVALVHEPVQGQHPQAQRRQAQALRPRHGWRRDRREPVEVRLPVKKPGRR